METTIYFFYIKTDGTITRLNNSTNQIDVIPLKEKGNFYYELMKGYLKQHADLIKFKNDFDNWNKQLIGIDKKLDITQYYSIHGAVELLFKWYAHFELEKLPSFNDVTFDEFLFIEDCCNVGIMYFDKNFKDITQMYYGYDFKGFYPQFLNKKKLKMFVNSGKKVKIDELIYDEKGKLPYGIYKCSITCGNPNFCKVFRFNKKNSYTHFDLEFIKEHKDKFAVSVALDTTVEFNALIYEGECVETHKIFKNWFKKTSHIKNSCEGNKLAKHLHTSLWGSLVKLKKSYYTDDEFSELDYSEDGLSTYYQVGETYFYKAIPLAVGGITGAPPVLIERFECIETKKPYKSCFARLKPFLLALSRNVVGNTIIKNDLLDNVVRIQTDGFVLNKEYDYKKFEVLGLNPILEEKTTGVMAWYNVNDNSRLREERRKKLTTI